MKSVNPKQWERRPPGKARPDPVLQAADLARELAVPVGALQEIATQSKAPFSVSAMTGFWGQAGALRLDKDGTWKIVPVWLNVCEADDEAA
jgi:hypothetical protein